MRTPLSSLRLFLWGLARLLRHGLPRRVIHTYVGIGDELLAASALRIARDQGIDLRGAWFVIRYADLHAGSSLPVRHLLWDARLFRLAQRLRRPVLYLRYETGPVGQKSLPSSEHILASFCRQLGVTGPVPLKPSLEVAPAKVDAFAPKPRRIVVHSSGVGARIPIPAKNWPVENMQAVVDALIARGLGEVVQLGLPGDPPLRGAQDLRGRLPLSQTAAFLAESALFIGMVGALMHLARAADCPAVIIYGGREAVGLAGYSANVNLVNQPACSPCYLATACPYDLPCMKAITPGDVLAAVERQLARSPDRPLPVEYVEI